ncbi:hypothetical protein AYL99_04527 [Fonsecaea erecta]|uniref:Uncharacterized protein n=1 Tax=Fonsecaea erecta TaxID=1367422 RepID=A0A178ZR60_9EURO|nr:hypothetical protein AYL99_04527 [Fonsecaea erecta]OAP62324.1 hypothetical protein AYL99_04527 [Fonsecaea erecta]
MDTLPSSVCRACRLRLLKPSSSRVFSTTSPRSYIPPESPAFVDVPQPLQPVRDFHPRANGLLPVPRELFPARRPDKPGQQYLDNVTRDPLPKNIPPPDHLTETGKYKRRMAELRKTHLRSALKELHMRKTSIDAAIAARSAAKQRERARLVSQTEREDAAHEARLAAKHEDRLDKLHTLYINSRTFITDREQLSAAIEKAFTTTGSIWRKDGRPDTVEEMIKRGRDRTADQGRGGMMLFSDVNERALKDQERMKKIAEKLSGGKL